MRHKYETRGVVLARTPAGEANTIVTVLTQELGLVHARAQGLRNARAKLAHALVTFAESDLTLVRGKEGWRLSGAVLCENWFVRMATSESRERAARVSGLVLRLVAGEVQETELFPTVRGFLYALSTLPRTSHDAAEVLAALRVLSALGLDAGELPKSEGAFGEAVLSLVGRDRSQYVSRVNRGISASGL